MDGERDGDLADRLVCFWMLGQGDERAAGAQNAGFFPRDFGNG